MKSLEMVAYESMYAAAQQAADNFYPSERYMVVVPFTVATIVAFLSALALTTVYIPSVTSTTLQLRSGVIPTFRNPKFDLYRFGADLVTILLGEYIHVVLRCRELTNNWYLHEHIYIYIQQTKESALSQLDVFLYANNTRFTYFSQDQCFGVLLHRQFSLGVSSVAWSSSLCGR